MNASGKSTLMKATGIAILLAQAGCFVPAKRMRLAPYRAVYTRILNQDNLFAGLSSFAVEMSELRDILRQAHHRTLVLGDELCSGTESISAQALVASGIQWLSSKRASFIFATHLHDLPKWIDLPATSVEVWHLHVAYDPVSKKLVYDRTLRPGSGSTLYGLEVARAMDLPFEFIEQAVRIRHSILHSTTQEQATASSWNREVVRRACEVCHTPIRSELEVHHLQERATATNHRLPDGSSVHDKRNLIVLCETCHLRVHSGSIQIGALQQTSDGPMRVVSPAPSLNEEKEQERASQEIKAAPSTPSIGKRSKWSEEEWKTMTDTVRQYPSLSLKSIRAHLDAKENIQVSESVLRTLRKEL
jgi:DNA mismatch repair protein MutS